MKNKLTKLTTIIIASIFGFGLFSLAPTAYATDDVCNSNAPQAVRDAAGCNGTDDQLPGFIINILNGIIAVSGLVAVIFVVIGGVNYMTSAGDTGKLEKAKKTILYACIGMAVTVLSFAIVNFTITNIIGGQRSSDNSEQDDDENDSDNTTPNANSANTPTQETE